jgi:CRP-like cAMP-binding protein
MVSPAELARIELFARFTPDDLGAVAACAQRRRYPRGSVVFLRGEPGDAIYVVEAGRVKIALTSPQGKELVLGLLGPGDFFGELAVFDGEPRSADAIAAEDSRLLVIHRADFRRDLEARPRMAVELVAVLSRRLRRDAELIEDAAFLDVAGRLARALLRLAEAEGQPAGAGTLIARRLTQAELAGLVGATRESVGKWLGAFERQGLVARRGGRITVLRPDALGRRAC